MPAGYGHIRYAARRPMRIARALILSPLVPLLGVAVIGIGMGCRSAMELGQFVVMWAIVFYPLVIALALGADIAARQLGCNGFWHFALGGFLVGSILSLSWFGLVSPADGGSVVIHTVVVGAISGGIGTATAVVFWRLAVQDRAA
jgi:hypothetical protein